MIADTTFLIDILRGKTEAVKKASELEINGVNISVGAPSIFELYVGAMRSLKSEEEKSKIVTTISSLPQLPLDYESASLAGEIFAKKLQTGAKIDPEDAMLAGISVVHGEAIIARNVKHFENIRGLSVESY